MEDIRIARKTWFRVAYNGSPSTNDIIVKANPSRVGLIFCLSFPDIATVFPVMSGVSNPEFPILLTPDPVAPTTIEFANTPTVYRIEQYGQLVTGAWQVRTPPGNDMTVIELIMDEI